MKNNAIKIRGACQHNLKNINVDIPKNKLVVFTGVSGSGKSSLAFDTIYAEGQRRYVESLSTYARQFLGIMEKPDVEYIEGLSPAISIDQKTTSRNPRSTVGTVTEIYDYLRLLYAKIGHPHCPVCGQEIASQSLDQIVDSVMQLLETTAKKAKSAKYLVLSPQVIDKKGEFSSLFSNLKAKGFKQTRIDDQIYDLEDELVLIKTNKHTIEVVIDKLSAGSTDFKNKIFKENLKSRLSNSIEQALKLSDGLVILTQVLDKSFAMPEKPNEFKDNLFSERFACPTDNIQIPEIEPRTFSFNSPHGACPKCSGIGKILKVDPSLIFSKQISITEGAILPFANMFEHDTWYSRLILKVCEENDIDSRVPVKNLTKKQIDLLLGGDGKREYRVKGTNRFGKITYIHEAFLGIIVELEKRHANTESDWARNEIEKYMRKQICPSCNGDRLKPEALNITIDRNSISKITSFSITQIHEWIMSLTNDKSLLNAREKEISKLILKEIQLRLEFLVAVGLEYLTIDRSAGTLSGGEAQRIRLASQIGSGLTGVLYVLDEPTIGLHARDNKRLIDTLKRLRDLGNTVVVVEHDAEMIRNADFVIDFGPGAGKAGGNIVETGAPAKIASSKKSLTGKYLSGKKEVKVEPVLNGDFLSQINNQNEVATNSHKLIVRGCGQYNLKNIDVEFPLGKMVVITGVSGSGKSTLLIETLYPTLLQNINPYFRGSIGKHTRIDGLQNVDKVILIDQSPIGRTPRSNPATYTKLFGYIRDVFENTREARALGFKKGRFSFNVKGGRCDACEGQGQTRIEMQFMSDIWVTCEVCNGSRYNAQTLDVEYKGKNIAEVLTMTINEAVEFFHVHNPIIKRLETLKAVGLGYMELGQSATTLSGGEAQRVKLATELSKNPTGKTVYILDEPTTGLHFDDVKKLLRVLRLLVSKGNSVFIIEHNMDIIKNADWIIDLGPEGGELGGELVAQGTIATLIKSKNSYTGRFLSKNKVRNL